MPRRNHAGAERRMGGVPGIYDGGQMAEVKRLTNRGCCPTCAWRLAHAGHTLSRRLCADCERAGVSI